jgi:hypothetical protein
MVPFNGVKGSGDLRALEARESGFDSHLPDWCDEVRPTRQREDQSFGHAKRQKMVGCKRLRDEERIMAIAPVLTGFDLAAKPAGPLIVDPERLVNQSSLMPPGGVTEARRSYKATEVVQLHSERNSECVMHSSENLVMSYWDALMSLKRDSASTRGRGVMAASQTFNLSGEGSSPSGPICGMTAREITARDQGVSGSMFGS